MTVTSVFAGKARRFRARGYERAFQQVMDGGTPKKIVDSDSKCFTCSSPSENAEKIYIFGKSSIDLQGIIKSSLNVDVSCSREQRQDICLQELLQTFDEVSAIF